MARILTGIQSSGRPHLGNILGAIKPAVALAQENQDAFLFIADLHSLISLKDSDQRMENVYATAAAWLACGLDAEQTIFYRQSKIHEHTELLWYLSCFTPYPMLANAHSFKDKSDKLSDINAGLFTYPVLMAADILLYDADIVPVGKDQLQHLEMTRDIAHTFNHQFGNVFVIPEAKVDEQVMVIPGTDGQKMSKSYHNTIDIFLPEKQLRKRIMSVVTDSTPLEQPKDPDQDNVFSLYQLLAGENEIEEMRRKYRAGNYGYGHAKQALFEITMDTFEKERALFDQFMSDREALEDILQKGEERARTVATEVINRVRRALSF
jgi:tryptophanyl-tRNA synthetase